jgi:putative transposase
MAGDRYYISDQQATYFLTFTVVGWIDVFTRKACKDIIVSSLNYCVENKGLRINSWCLMSNHLHLMASVEEPNTMSAFVRDFKKFTAKQILAYIEYDTESRKEWMLQYFKEAGVKDKRITTYKFWKEDNHAICIDPLDHFIHDQKIDYIHRNPVVEGIVENEEDYLYSSARDFYGMNGLVKIDKDD